MIPIMNEYMKKISLSAVLALIVVSVSFGQSASEDSTEKSAVVKNAQSIRDWTVVKQSGERYYDVYLDSKVFHSGSASGSIRSKFPTGNNRLKSALIMQTIKADSYRNQRIRISAYVKAENVRHASLWLRMDGEGMLVLGLDAMNNRTIQGTSDWKRYSIVLDVPDKTQQIIFGASLKGDGQIWIDDIEFENVGIDVPTTTTKTPEEFAKASAKRIEQYKRTNKDDYEKQLQAFVKRSETASLMFANLNFEDIR